MYVFQDVFRFSVFYFKEQELGGTLARGLEMKRRDRIVIQALDSPR